LKRTDNLLLHIALKNDAVLITAQFAICFDGRVFPLLKGRKPNAVFMGWLSKQRVILGGYRLSCCLKSATQHPQRVVLMIAAQLVWGEVLNIATEISRSSTTQFAPV